MMMNGPIMNGDAVIVDAAEQDRVLRLAAGRLPDAPLAMPTQVIERPLPLLSSLRLFAASRQQSAGV